jgi:peptidoglycan lytic transglycosylase G
VLPNSSKPAADPHGPVLRVVIPRGADASAIGGILEQRGVVDDGSRFRNYAKEQGEGADFKAGTYGFQAGEDYDLIIKRLDLGPAPIRVAKLVIPEGFRMTEIEARLPSVGISKSGYRRAVAAASPPPGFGSHSSMEGFLFPATYSVTPHERPSVLVGQQLAAFQNAFSQVDMSYAASKNLTPYDVLTIASMIEREAHVAKDRPLIAAVIYNRLHLGMTLGIDATLLYEQGSWSHQLTVSELEANTPYNTRVRHGLPPTPISNPGLASLQAAAHPAHVDYLYYVAQGDSGTHYFTDNYADFKAHGG